MKLIKNTSKRGFTLIELLVVIAIIGVLSSVVLVSLDQARERARIARVQSDLRSLNTAMQMYFSEHGEMPPIGDFNSAGSGTSIEACGSNWTNLAELLVEEGVMSSAIETDPWGNYYCYDDNYALNNDYLDSVLFSAGPNKQRETYWPQNNPPTVFAGDDIGISIVPGE